MRYRKKSVIIDAIQWTGLNLKDISNFVGPSLKYEINDIAWRQGVAPPYVTMWIDTLEGRHMVSVGDYVIRGVAGEYYACKPEIFVQTYDEVDSLDNS